MDFNLDLLLDYIYDKSSLNCFLKPFKVDEPHFYYGNEYYSLENYRTEIKVPFGSIRKIDEEFLQTLVKKVQIQIEDNFIEYIDKKAEVEHMSFFRNSPYKPPAKFFKLNTRFNLKNKSVDFKKFENIAGLIEQCRNEIYNGYTDEHLYAIVSPGIANYLSFLSDAKHNFRKFSISSADKFDPDFIHSFALFAGLNIFVNPRGDANTMYFGTTKRFETTRLVLAHYNAEHSFLEYTTMPDKILDMEKTYLVNLYYKIIEFNTPKQTYFKKIIFEI